MFTAAAAQPSLPPDALGSGSASSIAPSPRLLCSGPPLSWGGHGLWGGRGITNLFPSSSQTVHLPAEAWGGNCSNKTGWGFAQDRRYWIPLIDTEMLTEGAWAAHTNIQCWSSSAQASKQILNSSRDRNPPPLCVSFPSELLSEHFFHLCITTTLRHSTFVHSETPGHTLHLNLLHGIPSMRSGLSWCPPAQSLSWCQSWGPPSSMRTVAFRTVPAQCWGPWGSPQPIQRGF